MHHPTTANPLDVAQLIDGPGFEVISLLGSADISALRDAFDALERPADTSVFRTLAQSSRQEARAADRAIKAVLGPAVSAALPGWEQTVALFVHKRCGADTAIPFHQDWSLTDENRHTTIMLWIALDPSDRSNGGLSMVPGSHRWVSGVRPLVIGPQPTDDLQELLAARAVPVDVAAGHAVVYHPATIHGSGPNLGGNDRLAALVGLVPPGAPLLHFVEDQDGLVGFEVDEDFYTSVEHRGRPDGWRRAEPWAPPVRAEHLSAALADDAGAPLAPRTARARRRMPTLRKRNRR